MNTAKKKEDGIYEGMRKQFERRLMRNRDAFLLAWLFCLTHKLKPAENVLVIMDGLENRDINWDDVEALAQVTADRKTAFSNLLVLFEHLNNIGSTFGSSHLETLDEVRNFMLENGEFLYSNQMFDKDLERNTAMYQDFVKNVNIAFNNPTAASMGGRGRRYGKKRSVSKPKRSRSRRGRKSSR